MLKDYMWYLPVLRVSDGPMPKQRRNPENAGIVTNDPTRDGARNNRHGSERGSRLSQ